MKIMNARGQGAWAQGGRGAEEKRFLSSFRLIFRDDGGIRKKALATDL